jgi:pimeloyl-ACP methyl ester carboxylesterase
VHRRPGADPDATAVVFIHGAADRGAAFARVGRTLDAPTLIRYDRRGYGRSLEAEPPPGDGAELLAGQVDDLAGVLGTDAPAVVVGHSLGGLVALAAAATRPGLVASVVAYEPPTPWLAFWDQRQAGSAARQAARDAAGDDGDPFGAVAGAAAMEAFLRRMIGDQRWDALGERTQAARRAEGPALLRDLAVARAVGAVDLASISAPVVLGVGGATVGRHRRAVNELASAIGAGGARVEIAEVAGAAHGGHLTHPDGFANLVETGRQWARWERGGTGRVAP